MKFATEWKVIKFHGSKPPTSMALPSLPHFIANNRPHILAILGSFHNIFRPKRARRQQLFGTGFGQLHTVG